jgi:hypothetical protein
MFAPVSFGMDFAPPYTSAKKGTARWYWGQESHRAIAVCR